MSEQETPVADIGPVHTFTAPPAPTAPQPQPAAVGSLRDRMNQRREELRTRTSDLFPVPLWDQYVAVELRAIAWEASEGIVEKNQRVQKLALLYTAGDEIVKATVGFHEIKDDGSTEPLEDVHSWRDLAVSLAGHQLPEGVGDRVALIAMCDTPQSAGQNVINLNAQYRRWLAGAETGMGEQVRRDF